ncbi:DUF7519 family protein [Halorarius litoreus]|uniref:DUF7519 family protein n=1 Tax=Halorarius litoreus TaxID=2962676 RepID=UPI0020CC2FE4|nr:hypothetical protein [Halorarius litoreus]
MTDRDPLPLGSALSLCSAAVATALVATTGVQRTALLATVGGVAVVALGIRLARHGHRLVGGLLFVAGAGGVAIGFSRGLSTTPSLQFEIYPALVGVTLLGLGLAPVRRGWERWFVTAGSAAVLAAVVTSGVVRGTATVPILLAGVATVVAWDVGEQAVNLSNHVGTDARTHRVELVHGAAAVGVGVAAVAMALFVQNVHVTGVPLSGLGVLLGATVVLTTALYN